MPSGFLEDFNPLAITIACIISLPLCHGFFISHTIIFLTFTKVPWPSFVPSATVPLICYTQSHFSQMNYQITEFLLPHKTGYMSISWNPKIVNKASPHGELVLTTGKPSETMIFFSIYLVLHGLLCLFLSLHVHNFFFLQNTVRYREDFWK